MPTVNVTHHVVSGYHADRFWHPSAVASARPMSGFSPGIKRHLQPSASPRLKAADWKSIKSVEDVAVTCFLKLVQLGQASQARYIGHVHPYLQWQRNLAVLWYIVTCFNTTVCQGSDLAILKSRGLQANHRTTNLQTQNFTRAQRLDNVKAESCSCTTSRSKFLRAKKDWKVIHLIHLLIHLGPQPMLWNSCQRIFLPTFARHLSLVTSRKTPKHNFVTVGRWSRSEVFSGLSTSTFWFVATLAEFYQAWCSP